MAGSMCHAPDLIPHLPVCLLLQAVRHRQRALPSHSRTGGAATGTCRRAAARTCHRGAGRGSAQVLLRVGEVRMDLRVVALPLAALGVERAAHFHAEQDAVGERASHF